MGKKRTRLCGLQLACIILRDVAGRLGEDILCFVFKVALAGVEAMGGGCIKYIHPQTVSGGALLGGRSCRMEIASGIWRR